MFCSAVPGTSHTSRGHRRALFASAPGHSRLLGLLKIADLQKSSLKPPKNQKNKQHGELSVNKRGSERLICSTALIYCQEGLWPVMFRHSLARSHLQEGNECIHPCVAVWGKNRNCSLRAHVWEQEGTSATLATQPGANFADRERGKGLRAGATKQQLRGKRALENAAPAN